MEPVKRSSQSVPRRELREGLIESPLTAELYEYKNQIEMIGMDRWSRFKLYWVNDGPKLIIILLFLLANAALFLERFFYYWKGGGKAKFEVLGHGITMARGAAAALKLDCTVMILLVCRNLLSWLRGTWVNNIIPLDKAIVFHRYTGGLIVFWSAVHSMAHMFNWYSLSKNTPDMPSPYRTAFLTLAGATGHVICIAMVLMYSTSIQEMRRPYFEAFWFTHHIFVIFYGMLLVHGLAGATERATFWMWFAVPGAIYIVERVIRIMRGSKDTVLQKAIQHPSRVVELRMLIPEFRFKPGQYLFLNIPYFAAHEWHPFTISSAPQEEYVSVHIRIVGDWTGALYKELNPDRVASGILCENIRFAKNGSPMLRVDGPFGAASEHIFDFNVVMLVAAGIGVTPFASILRSIRCAYEDPSVDRSQLQLPQKVYFVWINRDRTAFEWFQDVLAELENMNSSNWLEINVYFTGTFKPDEVRGLMSDHDHQERDAISGLKSRTTMGRPQWKQIFTDLNNRHHGTKVGVFYCGPSILSKQLYKTCRSFTAKSATKFVFKKENF